MSELARRLHMPPAMKTQGHLKHFFIAAVATLLGACGPSAGPVGPVSTGGTPPAGQAYLTIIGNTNVFLDSGAQQTLTVKYTDAKNQPIAGQVSFAVNGTAVGATLSSASAVTASDGTANINVTGGTTGSAAFLVVASAQNADSVDWQVAVQGATPPTPDKPLDPTGTYTLESQFNLTAGLPGAAGDVVNTIIDMTDSPNDPATWLIDLALTKIDNSTVTSAVSAVRPALDSFLNDLLIQWTNVCDSNGNCTSIVGKLMQLGQAFGDITQKFGVESTLVITKNPDGTYVAKHTVTGVSWKINDVVTKYTLAELNMDPVVADNIPVALITPNDLQIADHTLGLNYGAMAVFAINNLLIPALDPFANDLTEALSDLIDCYSIGQQVASYVGVGDASLYESACDSAIAAGAAVIEGKISDLGGTGSSFEIHGDSRPVDTDGDSLVDQLADGEWEGTLHLGPASSVLAKPDQQFIGTRDTASRSEHLRVVRARSSVLLP